MAHNCVIRKATDEDLPQIQAILRPLVEQKVVLHRTRAEIQALFQSGFVAVRDSTIVGICAVEIYSKKLAEIQCLAVLPDCRGLGLGTELAKHCVELARDLGVMEVMAISASESFLQAAGFDYSLPGQKRALFYQLRSREEVFKELNEEEE